MKTISNRIIRNFNPCYDPSEVVKEENEELPVVEWVQKYRNLVHQKQDIVWLLCREDFMSDKDMRLFAVWCAREALKLIPEPDERSVNACDVAEKFANGEATEEELNAAWAAVWAVRDAANAAARAVWAAANACAARDAANAATWAVCAAANRAAVWAAVWAANRATANAVRDARNAQIDKLLTNFN